MGYCVMPLIPFGWLPGHWGLKGTTREIARIEYNETDPYTIEYKKEEYLFSMKVNTPENELEHKRVLLEINYKHKKISENEYEIQRIELLSGIEKQYQTLKLLLEQGDITEVEYRKEISTLENKPFFDFNIFYEDGELELETYYNSLFIKYLKKNGYNGDTDEEIIDWYVRDCGRLISEDEEQPEGLEVIKKAPTPTGSEHY